MEYVRNSNIEECRYFGDKLFVTLNGTYRLTDIDRDIFVLTDGINSINDIVDKVNLKNRSEETKDVNWLLNYYEGSEFYEIKKGQDNRNIQIKGETGKYFPKRIQFELTNGCNFNCKFCYKSANVGKAVFLDDKIFKKVFDFTVDSLNEIAYTGGEPLLHPKFCEFVQNAYEKGKRIHVNTNGTLLGDIDISVLKMLNSLSVTLYGTNDNEYEMNTGNKLGYTMLEKSCKVLKRNNIKFLINILVDRQVYQRLEEHVQCAIKLGAYRIKIGKICKIGKAMDIKSDEVGHSVSFEREVYRALRKMMKKYGDRVEFDEWERTLPFAEDNDEVIYSNCCLACNAGNWNWAINEKGKMKPCVMCPDACDFTLPFEEWKNYVEGKTMIDWQDYYDRLVDLCNKNKIDVTDYCESLSVKTKN